MLINDFKYFHNKSKYHKKTSGMDHPKEAYRLKADWYTYTTQDFDYKFNTWAFRGPEYAQYVGKSVNICLGDSFTVNVGESIDNSWCSQLAKNFDIPTLNLGMDGAGNDAIRLVYDRACKIFDVRDTFVMYSFLHRRLDNNFNFIQENAKLRDNISYFLQQRIANVYEAALPSWCWSLVERAFLKRTGIFIYSSKNNEKVISEERNRDGFHMSNHLNKMYADYFYNQWKQTNDL